MSQPITQIVGLLTLLIGVQKAGFNVIGALQSLLGTRDAGENTATLRNDFQAILMQMEQLSLHFNHETTDNQTRLEEKQDRILGKIDDHLRMHDRTNYLLEDIKTNGIKCRQ